MGTEGTDLPDDLDWVELYTVYGPALRRAIGRSAPAADVEDILQNTFLRLARMHARGQVDLSKPLLPLLVTLAQRARIDHWRTRRRETTVVQLPDDQCARDVPEAELEAVELLADILASLRPRDKRLLFRCEVEGASRRALGAEEVLSDDALKMALSRARRRFRNAYLATLAERGLLSVWGVLLGVRSRLHRAIGGDRGVEEVVRLGFGITAAAAAITLAVATVGPQAAGASDPVRTVVSSNEQETASPVSPQRATFMEEEGERGLSTRTGVDSAFSSNRPAPQRAPIVRSPEVELRRAEGTLGAEPDNPSVRVHFEWSDPVDSGHGSAGVEFRCSPDSKIATAACPVLRQLPGTDSNPDD